MNKKQVDMKPVGQASGTGWLRQIAQNSHSAHVGAHVSVM